MNWVDPPPPQSTVTCPGLPELTSLVALLAMSRPVLKLMFEGPDQLPDAENMAKNPVPEGDAHVRLHSTVDTFAASL